MSLINDALKRANQAQKTRPPVGPLGVPLQPADAGPGRHWVSVALVTVVLMVALGGAVWLVWVGWRSIRKPPSSSVAGPPPTRQNAEAATAPKPPPAAAKAASKDEAAVPSIPVVRQVQPPNPPPVTPKPAPQVAIAPENPPPAPPVTAAVRNPPPVPVPGKSDATAGSPSTAPVAVASPKPMVAPAEVPPPPAKLQFPELKLQGIFYLASRPSALISGKTVFRGDLVLGAKVVSIEKLSVTLEFEGETKVLSLE